ncbi:MAG: 8-oxoguanine deaminase [Gloeocapsa sp. DLM2.Bin57]|nr:MAG: 8-oxoguanine deaminase [Gloeocapsa sp. DLM2.Bin57]
MSKTLIRNIRTLVTMDDQRREISNGAILINNNLIEKVGTSAEITDNAAEILDLDNRYIVLPGLINTHHHFFQVLTRVIPQAQNATLFDWLESLYPLWSKLTPEGLYISSQMAAAELMLSGCTTACDHLYLFPNGCQLDDQLAAIAEIGLRFHACRGSMSVGKSQGGLPPDSLVETEAAILKDSQRLIEQYHDYSPQAMVRIVLAPCSPFSVTPDLMRESASLARSYPGVRLHTHLAENRSDIDYSLATFGLTPEAYAESVGWLGEDVWHAHCVQLTSEAIALFAQTQTGVTHCPSSNMRLGSGIAPIRDMLNQGVPVSLGVDGSASNDTGNLFLEARNAFLLARVRDCDASAITAREVLEIATLGGARVLGRDDLGSIQPGMSADVIAINCDRPELAGVHDVIAGSIFCHITHIDYSFINGQKVIDRGQLTTIDLPKLITKINSYAQSMTT